MGTSIDDVAPESEVIVAPLPNLDVSAPELDTAQSVTLKPSVGVNPAELASKIEQLKVDGENLDNGFISPPLHQVSYILLIS